jgi:hypothetical protein
MAESSNKGIAEDELGGSYTLDFALSEPANAREDSVSSFFAYYEEAYSLLRQSMESKTTCYCCSGGTSIRLTWKVWRKRHLTKHQRIRGYFPDFFKRL